MHVTIKRVDVIPLLMVYLLLQESLLKLLQLKNYLWPNKRPKRRRFPLLTDTCRSLSLLPSLQPPTTFTSPAGGKKENTGQIAKQFPPFDSVSREMRQEVNYSSRPPVTGRRLVESATPWSQIGVWSCIFWPNIVHISSQRLIHNQLLGPSLLSTPQRPSQENEFSMPWSYLIARHFEFRS